MQKHNKHMVFLIVVCIAAGLLFGNMIINKIVRQIDNMNSEIQAKKKEQDDIQKWITKNKSYVSKWEKISEFQSQSVADLQTRFASYLQATASKNAFNFDKQSAPTGKSIKDHEEFQLLTYKLTFSAAPGDLAKFLGALDKSDKLLCIDSMDVSSKKDSSPGYYSMALSSTKDLTVNIDVSIPAATEDDIDGE